MKTRLVALLLAVGVSLVFLAGAQAQENIIDRIGVGARASYILPRQDETLDSVLAVEGVLVFGIHRFMAAELSVGLSGANRPKDESGSSRITYVNLSFQGRGEPTDNVGVYVGIGPSMIFNKWTSRHRGSEEFVRGKDSFGGHLSFGLDYFIIKNLAINVDAKYHLFYNNWYARRAPSDSRAHSVNTGDWLVGFGMGAGLKLFF